MTTMPERTATLTDLVAAEIRAWLGRLDVRPSELARRIGENDQWLSTRLKGRTPINVNDMHRIAKALDLEVGQLMPAPDLAAGAADPRTTVRNSPLAVRLTAHIDRPRDNRPDGRPGGASVRTAYIDRSGRRPGGR